MTDSTASAVPPATFTRCIHFGRRCDCPEPTQRQQCPTCTWGVVLGVDDEIACPDCGGACFIDVPDAVPAHLSQYGDGPHDEPQDQR